MNHARTKGIALIFSTPSHAIRAYPALAAIFLVPTDGDEYPLFLCGRANDPRAVGRAARLVQVLTEMPVTPGGTMAVGYVAGRYIAWDTYSLAFIESDNSAPATHGKILALMRNTYSQERIYADSICASQDVVAAMVGIHQ